MADAVTYDAVILGAGPAGLTAACALSRSGVRVAVVEPSTEPGGNMRPVRHDGFALDLGRKELYDRLPGVYDFWKGLLAADFRPYDRRVGSLTEGIILETSSRFRGMWRGATGPQTARILGSHFWNQFRPSERRAENLGQYVALLEGEAYLDSYVKGYTEKLLRRPISAVMPPGGATVVLPWQVVNDATLSGFRRSSEPVYGAPGYDSETGQTEWRHPVGGTGALVDALVECATAHGATLLMGAFAEEVRTAGGAVKSVIVRHDRATRELGAAAVISSLPLDRLQGLLKPAAKSNAMPPSGPRAATIVVYLFSSRGPEFPHHWLLVNDAKYRVGRVVNYGAWNAGMTPEGANALAMEYFVTEGDDLWSSTDEELRRLALFEAADNSLVRRDDVTPVEVVRLPGADAATSLNGWDTEWRQAARAAVTAVKGLHDANRPGTDRATCAGIEAADAVRSGGPMDGRSLAA